MINGFGAEIFIYPPQGGEPSKAGEAREWRIEGALLFTREKPVGLWASQKPVMRATSVILAGWTFDEYFLSSIQNSFLLLLHAGGSLSHRATGKIHKDSIQTLIHGQSGPIAFESCAIQPALFNKGETT